MLVLLWARNGVAHDLEIDQLSLSVGPTPGTLNGQIQFDPELCRGKDEPPSAAAEQRVRRFLEQNLELQVDGKPALSSYTVRELWVKGGATLGDLVMITAHVPPDARQLRVFVPSQMKALVVSVRKPMADGAWTTHSALTLGGQWSDPYRLDGATPQTWREGGADQFSLDAGAAPAPSPTAAGPGAAVPSAASRPQIVGESRWQQAKRYLVLGVEHIVPRGFDHVLFVAGLVLASRRLKPLFVQLTAFTVAHSLTLALGALNIVVLPRGIVEPLIAASIAFVAIQNLLQKGEPKSRPFVVLLFGLLHGQGFAGALSELALPHDSFLLALISFNIGVELGQLLVVALVLLALYPIRDPVACRKYALVPGSVVIAGTGLYWSVERLFG